MKVDFIFDFASPNAYCCHKVIPEIENRTGIKFNYHRLFLHYGYFDLWLIMYNQTMIIVPYLLMGPGLFSGAMTFGILIQT